MRDLMRMIVDDPDVTGSVWGTVDE